MDCPRYHTGKKEKTNLLMIIRLALNVDRAEAINQ
jgi:hypothetical protein